LLGICQGISRRQGRVFRRVGFKRTEARIAVESTLTGKHYIPFWFCSSSIARSIFSSNGLPNGSLIAQSQVEVSDMKGFFATTCIVTGAMLAGGCATKKYVRNTAAPIQAKVDQVGEQTNQNGQAIQDTKNNLKQVDERAQSGISAAQERASTADQHAMTADQHAGAAMNQAKQATQTADQANHGLDSLRQVVANIDDYKLQSSATVPFKFNQYRLTPDAEQELDKLVDEIKPDHRFFVAVEGYTDNVGTKQYNEVLSRRRADSVVEYLVGKHDIPIYRVHMIGLGEQKPVEDAKTREARAKNRRVEVKVFSADQVTASLGSASRDNAAPAPSPNQ
jgi:outer membrane protein OmpA-like peptidoglycan-associated protein